MHSGFWTPGTIENTKLVIVGAGEFAQIAFEYFTHDSPYCVVGFSVERDFIGEPTLCGLPVVPFDEIETAFSPLDTAAFVAVTYTKLNRVRTRLHRQAKDKGYAMACYVSSRAFVWHNVQLGDNVFIFENNVVQHHAVIEDNTVLWSGNHIGHRSVIERNCYLASHAVVSGYCRVGASSFIGVNATLADNVTVGCDCLIGAGALILKDVPDNTIVPGAASPRSSVSSRRFHRLAES